MASDKSIVSSVIVTFLSPLCAQHSFDIFYSLWSHASLFEPASNLTQSCSKRLCHLFLLQRYALAEVGMSNTTFHMRAGSRVQRHVDRRHARSCAGPCLVRSGLPLFTCTWIHAHSIETIETKRKDGSQQQVADNSMEL